MVFKFNLLLSTILLIVFIVTFYVLIVDKSLTLMILKAQYLHFEEVRQMQ